MWKNLYILFFPSVFVLFYACSSEKYELRGDCKRNNKGDYIIRWELFPPPEGIIKIYQSQDSENFQHKIQIAEPSANYGVMIHPADPLCRSYFILDFKKKAHTIASNRVIKTEKIMNFRDIGGYYTRNEEQLKWGKIYRSGTLHNMTDTDKKILDNLQIKTVLDLRSEEEIRQFPSKYKAQNNYQFSLKGINPDLYLDKITHGQIKRGDALILQQDLLISLLEENNAFFSQYFEIIANPVNYPVVMFCSLGKDRVGILTALTLAALDVNNETIYQDYLLSNSNIAFQEIISDAISFPVEVQEALTSFLYSQEQVILYVKNYIEKKYGSWDDYLEKEVKLTSQKREKLKELLLY